MRLIPIRPKKPVIPNIARIDGNVHRDLRDFGVKMQSQMEHYPTARPWKNPPKSGLRRGGKRTGRLRGGWATGLRMSRFRMDLVNQVPYGMPVQGYVPGYGKGRRQSAVMRARGWQNISTEVKKTWPTYRLRLQKSLAGR